MPELNFPLFHRAANWLRQQGFEVENPADNGPADPAKDEDPQFRREIILDGISKLFGVSMVAMLPGWEKSKGASAEKAFADATGIEVAYLHLRDNGWAISSSRDHVLPSDSHGRKDCPVASGVLDYFPNALVEVARTSKAGNDQHNAGQPLHWARDKSTDEADALIRHFLERGKRDTDGLRHSAKMAWRALALLQKEIEADEGLPPSRASR